MRVPDFESACGVDFSGAKRAGRCIWVARLTVPRTVAPRLVSLDRLDRLCGTAERGVCLAALVEIVNASEGALWGFDCPFGLPVELFPENAPWADHFAFLAEYEDAYDCGLECIRRTQAMSAALHRTALHCRRQSDVAAKAPFDAFHYRMIYQTFFGMRDVVRPLAATPGTAVLPFQYRKVPKAKRVVVECCPSSVLKRDGLPHQNYKHPKGGPLPRRCVATRHAILEGLARRVRIGDHFRRVIMRNPGGDALDAVIAAVGALRGVREADHKALAVHPRLTREGWMYV
ncbi:hypothetical protein GobsT_63290 [Gemmata obscuriglobus]|uniref:DUF429 domain-containing protein n=1 Tax=Gemmata obscuriglobus TaxID=114 RepID=A0A2Z3GX04_9BACT|nr:DUF429 domain-containing protein [Gemmata obscuriglobus]QEG31507.1 hypothetical protein GobsT_63290 [Gemmata obscuriglobus]VTS10849.1 Uncharacterized protein OS=Rhodopirellula baltica SH28 GN=RBSH_05623 PE=4 SV=1 [Gemmata obscuriglobus UQM 2246]